MKLGLILGTLGFAASTLMAAQTLTYSGTNVGGPSWDRPIAGGPSISGLGPVNYHAYLFHANGSGTCDFASVQTYDGYIHVYKDSFDPNNQLDGLLGGNDDGISGIGTSNLDNIPVVSGSSYYVITSAFAAGDEGTFDNTITCDVDITDGVSVPLSDTAKALLSLLFAAGALYMFRRRVPA